MDSRVAGRVANTRSLVLLLSARRHKLLIRLWWRRRRDRIRSLRSVREIANLAGSSLTQTGLWIGGVDGTSGDCGAAAPATRRPVRARRESGSMLARDPESGTPRPAGLWHPRSKELGRHPSCVTSCRKRADRERRRALAGTRSGRYLGRSHAAIPVPRSGRMYFSIRAEGASSDRIAALVFRPNQRGFIR